MGPRVSDRHVNRSGYTDRYSTGSQVSSDLPALPMHPPRPIRIRYFEAVTDTERHVRDGSVIEPEDYRPGAENLEAKK